MPTDNPIQIMLRHNRWANERLMESCKSLTDEQFSMQFKMGLGSLQATITHILGAMRGWTDMLAQKEFRPRLEEEPRTIHELSELHDEVANELDSIAGAHPITEEVSRERDGRSFTFTRAGVLTHVTTHGMHHRAQCLNMLRQLGIDPLPASSVLEWMLMVDAN